MGTDDRRTELRIAIHRDDPAAIVTALAKGPEADALQLTGDAVRRAVEAAVPEAATLGDRFIHALHERDWTGDEALAARLAGVLGNGPVPLLRPLPVDLEELASVLEGDAREGGGRLDRRTGEVWPTPAIEYAREEGEEDEDESEAEYWLPVPCEGSRDGYRDMAIFIDFVSDERLRERLETAVRGRGAFRRFKDKLSHRPEDLARWFAFSDERQRGRARAWLADEGYVVGPA